MQRIVLGLAALLVAGIAAGAAFFAYDQFLRPRDEPVSPAQVNTGSMQLGGGFTLTDHTGQRVSSAELIDGPTLIYFGYTFCPDICPITLAKMKRLYGALGERRAQDLAVVFVSVDPERDTREKLAGYVPGFDRRFYGVRAEGESLVAAKRSFAVTSRTRQASAPGGEAGFYYVDHTGSIFLVDEHRRLRVVHPVDAPVEDLTADVRALLAEGRG